MPTSKMQATPAPYLVPMGRIELPTSPLPRECSTTEPHGQDALQRTHSGAGDGNRTRVISLEGWGSTIELLPHNKRHRVALVKYMVEEAGFEPA